MSAVAPMKPGSAAQAHGEGDAAGDQIRRRGTALGAGASAAASIPWNRASALKPSTASQVGSSSSEVDAVRPEWIDARCEQDQQEDAERDAADATAWENGREQRIKHPGEEARGQAREHEEAKRPADRDVADGLAGRR